MVRYPGVTLTNEEKRKRLYHYTSFDSFVKIWLSKKLLFSNVSYVNDLYESNFSMRMHSLNSLKYSDEFRECRKKYKQVSLTMRYDSYLDGDMSLAMWGIYGKSGKGVCIELDYNKLNLKGLVFGNIFYEDPLPLPPSLDEICSEVQIDDFILKYQKQLLFTKHKSWQFENEFKILKRDCQENEGVDIRHAITAITVAKWKEPEAQFVLQLLENETEIAVNYLHTDYRIDLGQTIIVKEDLQSYIDNQTNRKQKV